MDIRNCKMCGKLFNYYEGPPICKACADELEKKFYEVRDYIYEHPRASMTEISEANDISIKQIQKWIREERLSFTEDSQVSIECENCGAMIRTGRFCAKCKATLKNDLKTASYVEPEKPKKPVVDQKGQVRFLDHL